MVPSFFRDMFHYARVRARYPKLDIDPSSRLDIPLLGSYKFGKKCRIFKTYLGAYSQIGDFSYISGPATINSEKEFPFTLGNFCSLSSCYVTTRNHPFNTPSTHPMPFMISGKERRALSKNGSVSIANDVWAGHGAMIMPGVRIGNGAIIAAGAVVTKNVEPYSIAAGVPAVAKKKRFGDGIISQLEEIKWWNWPEEKIRRNKMFFTTDLSRHSGPLRDLISD